jgi:hypothetical protein
VYKTCIIHHAVQNRVYLYIILWRSKNKFSGAPISVAHKGRMRHRTSYFCGALSLVRHRNLNSVAHGLVRHKNLIFVAKFLWRTAHAPQNMYIGAPLMRLSLLVPTKLFLQFLPP